MLGDRPGPAPDPPGSMRAAGRGSDGLEEAVRTMEGQGGAPSSAPAAGKQDEITKLATGGKLAAPLIVAVGLSPAQLKAYRIADNQSATSSRGI